jgi:hypothetical protein
MCSDPSATIVLVESVLKYECEATTGGRKLYLLKNGRHFDVLFESPVSSEWVGGLPTDCDKMFVLGDISFIRYICPSDHNCL